MPTLDSRFVHPFRSLTIDDVPRVGGKNASLGEMIRSLSTAGVRVPDGFAVTAEAFRAHLAEAGIADEIYRTLDGLDLRDVAALETAGRRVRELVARAELPAKVWEEIDAAYAALSQEAGEAACDVAVRSSATAEDLPTASFAGQQETYLFVTGRAALRQAVLDCMASLFTDRAIVYRAERGFAHRDVALSVGVQRMVRSVCAGVVFTLDTESGFRDVVLVTGAWGLGETVVQGSVGPDELWVHKPMLRAGHRPIVRRERGEKAIRMVRASGAGAAKPTRIEPVPEAERQRFVLSDDEVLALARWALVIEDHYSARHGRPTPMDIEWAKDERTGELAIVQARPETVHSQRAAPTIELYTLRRKGKLLARGKSVGGKVATGRVRVLRGLDQRASFRPGEVLVTAETGPDWEPILHDAVAVVTDRGGRTCHAAIVSRELGIPCVVGTENATRALETGQEVTVSCAEGDEGHVYEGTLAFEREEIDPSALPTPKLPLLLNVGSPERAFWLAQLPSGGVGLARMELIVLNAIGVHPMALVHPERVSPKAQAEIERRTRGFASGPELFVSQLATGVAQIAAAFHPRPVILRFSDFKTNEYRELVGGDAFEPAEANPMIGFRGASRYCSERYREGFALECAAVRRVREEMGLVNLKLMVPFCRTLEEGRQVIQELVQNGLVRGERGLEVYVMCEIPSNALLAEEFSELFDGFSIGSNDLTQLTLGIDRDSSLLADLFDERDPAVKKLVRMVVEAAHRRGRKVGICGQAPSDYPDFAEFLAEIGIDSISLNPDSLATVARRLAR